MSSIAPKYRWFTSVFVVALGLDQLTKMWARHALKPIFPDVITVIRGFFELRYSENPGAAFGLFRSIPGSRYLLFVAGLGACFLVAQYLRKAAPETRRIAAELGLLAGGLGNLIDRVAFGRVTDFVVWKAGGYEWPTFNLADAWLVVGVIGLLIDTRPGTQKQKDGDKGDKGGRRRR
jgi:signal peptidase II